MKEKNKLVTYTQDNKATEGILTRVGNSNYFLHNDRLFPGSSRISYDP